MRPYETPDVPRVSTYAYGCIQLTSAAAVATLVATGAEILAKSIAIIFVGA
jgi:hypothetical protein